MKTKSNDVSQHNASSTPSYVTGDDLSPDEKSAMLIANAADNETRFLFIGPESAQSPHPKLTYVSGVEDLVWSLLECRRVKFPFLTLTVAQLTLLLHNLDLLWTGLPIYIVDGIAGVQYPPSFYTHSSQFDLVTPAMIDQIIGLDQSEVDKQRSGYTEAFAKLQETHSLSSVNQQPEEEVEDDEDD